MSDLPFEIVLRDRIDAPEYYTLAPGERFIPQTIKVEWDSSLATGPFQACLSFYTPDGQLLARTFPSETLIARQEINEVTYAPF